MSRPRMSRFIWTVTAVAVGGFFTVVLWPLAHEGFREMLFGEAVPGSRSDALPSDLPQSYDSRVAAPADGNDRDESEPPHQIEPSTTPDSDRKVAGNNPPKFREVEIRSPFDEILRSDPLLMGTCGASVVRMADDSDAVFAVASTPITDLSPEERLRAEKVCRVKALASLLGQDQPILVIHSDELRERTTAIVEPRGRRTSVSEVLSITRVQLEGYVRDMPIVGRWLSEDGRVFYLAIGGVRGDESD